MHKHTGNVQTFTAPCSANYKLEVWGAQGGYPEGGKGGYSFGNKSLNSSINLYIVVGGKGRFNVDGSHSYNEKSAGYNGGGVGQVGGGGATHIAQNNRGILQNYVNNKAEVYIVAGGGGGFDSDAGGGDGGGNVGQDGYDAGQPHSNGKGGTQTAGGGGYQNGSFGKGGNASNQNPNDSAGAGGGGWYGGGSSYDNGGGSGGGGSGYIGGVSNGTTTSGVQSGDGYAVITWMPVL